MFALPGRAIDRKSLVEYAASLKGKKKAELKEAIYRISKPKKVLSYGTGSSSTWAGFYKTYNLLGMPVAPDAKGFVIRNGRKYFNW